MDKENLQNNNNTFLKRGVVLYFLSEGPIPRDGGGQSRIQKPPTIAFNKINKRGHTKENSNNVL